MDLKRSDGWLMYDKVANGIGGILDRENMTSSKYYPRERIPSHPNTGILSVLDNHGRNHFNRDIAKSIFQECPQNGLGDVKIGEFVQNYARGVINAQTRIQQLNNEIKQLYLLNSQAREELVMAKERDAKRAHKGTFFAYLDGQLLLIRLIDVTGLKLDSKYIYVTFSVDGDTKKSKSIEYGKTGVFNESFEFELQGTSRYFTVQLYKEGSQPITNWAGMQEVSIVDINRADNKRKVCHLELFDQKNNYMEGRN